jgi:hypothetical protein
MKHKIIICLPHLSSEPRVTQFFALDLVIKSNKIQNRKSRKMPLNLGGPLTGLVLP